MKPTSPRRKGWIVGGLAVLVVVVVGARMMLPPRALSFTGGRAVALTAYKGPSPIGVPAELSSADLVTRGRYLAQAADCEVCQIAAVVNYVTARFGAAPSHLTAQDIAESRQSSSQ